MSTKPQVPYITAWSGETMDHGLGFVWSDDARGLRLTYKNPHPGDWSLGVLWMRQGLTGGGKPEWKRVNALRQRRCMLRKLCQVCGGSAVDQVTGRTWWLLADEADRGPAAAGYTNAPPTCLPCIPDSLTLCPHLRRGSAVYTVSDAQPYGVIADLFAPSGGKKIVHVQRSATLQLDEFRKLQHALAKQLLVVLDDLVPYSGIPRVPESLPAEDWGLRLRRVSGGDAPAASPRPGAL
ncbi:hypothetical protein GCM10009560_76170 [Nonomuraea longicatena]|uniref:Uncharacterized protein n=1 Tax=Nonomuraea longicatena TaxID=83682 RepID=A0ABN1R8B1_9ACTN